jgi:hypothetical protein
MIFAQHPAHNFPGTSVATPHDKHCGGKTASSAATLARRIHPNVVVPMSMKPPRRARPKKGVNLARAKILDQRLANHVYS